MLCVPSPSAMHFCVMDRETCGCLQSPPKLLLIKTSFRSPSQPQRDQEQAKQVPRLFTFARIGLTDLDAMTGENVAGSDLQAQMA